MNIIEIVGYLAIYLFLGWVVSPIRKSALRFMGKSIMNIDKKTFIFFWPISILTTLLILWGDGIKAISIFSSDGDE